MDQEPLFKINNYEVHLSEDSEPFGDGRYSNYAVVNTDNKITEITTSTFVQAVSISLELHKGEEALNNAVTKMLAEDAKVVSAEGKISNISDFQTKH